MDITYLDHTNGDLLAGSTVVLSRLLERTSVGIIFLYVRTCYEGKCSRRREK